MTIKPPVLLTKILATVGPASESVEQLIRLIEEGARVFRINFSHGHFDEFASRIAAVREASEQSGVPVGILGDLCGPKIRVERVKEPFELKTGDWVEITSKDYDTCQYEETGVTLISTTYPEMVHDAQPGDRVFINDGAIRLLVVDNPYTEHDEAPRLHARVTIGGLLSNKKGINLPDSEISAPSLTDYDRECVDFALAQQVDFLALSFVRHAKDLDELRELIQTKAPNQPVPILVAKIEKPEAMRELDAICQATDALMVARGDLGVEMDPTQVPVLQKQILRTAHAYGKPVIVATQMLESMIHQANATRAEVSDVANAISEGTDAVMLSGETAVGKFPVQAVNTMARTALAIESFRASDEHEQSVAEIKSSKEAKYRTEALAHGVSVIVRDLKPRYVVVWSEAGGSARYLSQRRLSVPIIALSSNKDALKRMSLMFGVTPIYMPRPEDTQALLNEIDTLLLENDWAEPGDALVLIKGHPIGTSGVTNQIQIHYTGDVCRVK